MSYFHGQMTRCLLLLVTIILMQHAPVTQAADPDVGSLTFYSYDLSRTKQKPGQSLTLQGTFTLNSFGDAEELYCAFRNMNVTKAPFQVLETSLRVDRSKTKTKDLALSGIKSGISTDGLKKIYWQFYPEGADKTEGKTFVLTTKIKLSEIGVTVNDIWWRFYCETKFNDETWGNFPNYYFWSLFKKVEKK